MPEDPIQPPHQDPIVRVAAGAASLACIEPSRRARPRDGAYDQIVALRSTCRFDATCDVATNGAPEIRILVPAGGHVDVLTTRGATADPVPASIACELARVSHRDPVR